MEFAIRHGGGGGKLVIENMLERCIITNHVGGLIIEFLTLHGGYNLNSIV